MADQDETAELEGAEAYGERRSSRRGRRVLAAAIVLVAFGGFAGLIYYAYSKGREAGTSTVAPIIRAGDGPTKVRPEQPGGMQVPNQDKEVYSRVGPGQGTQRVENLLPPPEQPLPRPALRQAPEPPPGGMLSPAPAPPLPPPPPIASVGVPQGLDTTPAKPPAAAAPPPQTPTMAARPAPSSPPAVPAAPPQFSAPAPPPFTAPPARPAAAPPPQPQAQPAPQAAPPAQRPPQAAALSPAPAAGGYRVQLVALRSEEAALAEWEKLKRANPDLFNGLAPSVVRVDLGVEKGVYYRLQAGPLAGQAQAADLCDRAKSRKLGCLVVKP